MTEQPAIDPRAIDVLDFWFGAGAATARVEWFRKDAGFDALIRERFGELLEQALHGALDGWIAGQPAAALARIVVLDQFTRNAFRDTPRAFAGDASALAGARELVARGGDQVLTPLQRVFVYLPFEHAEDRAMQRESLRLFSALLSEDASTANFEDYARRHAEVIERFGRFPHRNEVLGRVSTADETAFLQQPGSRF
jgi:uncharacterized protein (DUF924 family)